MNPHFLKILMTEVMLRRKLPQPAKTSRFTMLNVSDGFMSLEAPMLQHQMMPSAPALLLCHHNTG